MVNMPKSNRVGGLGLFLVVLSEVRIGGWLVSVSGVVVREVVVMVWWVLCAVVGSGGEDREVGFSAAMIDMRVF